MPRPRHPKTRRRCTIRDSPTSTAYVWIEAARSFQCRASGRSEARARACRAERRVRRAEPRRGAHEKRSSRRRRWRRAVPITIGATSTRARCRWRRKTTPGDVAKLGAYRQALDAAIAALPQDVELVLLRGIAESSDPADRGQGSVAGSVPYYERALALSPGHVAAHHYLDTRARKRGTRTGGAGAFSSLREAGAGGAARAPHAWPQPAPRAAGSHEAIAEFEAADRAASRVCEAGTDPGRVRLALRAQSRTARRPRFSTRVR